MKMTKVTDCMVSKYSGNRDLVRRNCRPDFTEGNAARMSYVTKFALLYIYAVK